MSAPGKRWKHRPEGSNWGEFGPDDERGRMNLITPEIVRRAVAEVREGLTFCLSMPLDYPGGRVLSPHRFPPELRPTDRRGTPNFHFPLQRENPAWGDVVCDDAVLMALQYSTQWDALGHVGHRFDADGDGEAELVYYNGWRAGTDIPAPGERSWIGDSRLGIEHMAAACVQTRGVMLDLHAHFGTERKLIGLKELTDVMRQDGVTVEEGDVLCLHTGFAREVMAMNKQPDPERVRAICPVLDGYDRGLLQWITESGIVAIAADNYAVESIPARPVDDPHAYIPLHEHCLFKLGVHLGELWYMSELAGWLRGAGRSRFLLTAPPLRLPGAVGSPATPVATV